MPSSGFDHVARKNRNRKSADRILRDQLWPNRELEPPPGEIHAEFVGRAWTDGLLEAGYRKPFAELCQKLFVAVTVEVFHDTIVVEDGHLPFRENHRQKITVRTFPAARRSDARGRQPNGGDRRRCKSRAGLRKPV
jgi:hypothetical protein